MYYHFLLEGETVEGDLICEFVEFENCEDSLDAQRLAENEAVQLLKHLDGGHIDIFDEDGTFLVDIEV